MSRTHYPFAAIVGQSEMKLALLLAAVDWRLGVLLRGDKGSGKTTTARGLAALLPGPAPFINLPIGATEDRLLGGLHLERMLQGDPVLKPGLVSEAHGGVLYVDEVNLLPAHLGDALLDVAASGVHVVEREGLSAQHRAEFVLLGSMNPEEGVLRPQLLDRFALSVTVSAPFDPAERQLVMERRMAFERDADRFAEDWSSAQRELHIQILDAREALGSVVCSSEMLGAISAAVCEQGVRSMRADLAVVRAAIAYAALAGDAVVEAQHVTAVLPLVLAHRTREGGRGGRSSPPQGPTPGPQQRSEGEPGDAGETAMERIFAPRVVETPAVRARLSAEETRGDSARTERSQTGPVTGSRPATAPTELDVRSTLIHTLRETGGLRPRMADLQERVRTPRTGTRYLLVIDSSGSHAAQQRMRLVKGAIASLLQRSWRREDEVAMIVFRGSLAQVVLEPTGAIDEALAALEYLPTGGRTPLAAALERAQEYQTDSTLLVLLTDGRANVALYGGDPWQEALAAAGRLDCATIVVDTESAAAQRLGQCVQLAELLGARYMTLEELTTTEVASLSLEGIRTKAR
jgi:magnesium chelatase subunit D